MANIVKSLLGIITHDVTDFLKGQGQKLPRATFGTISTHKVSLNKSSSQNSESFTLYITQQTKLLSDHHTVRINAPAPQNTHLHRKKAYCRVKSVWKLEYSHYNLYLA